MVLKASYEFENGYVRPIYRGIVLWNGSEDNTGPGNPEREFNDLVYDLVSGEDALSGGYHLKGIKVTIEIEEATKQ